MLATSSQLLRAGLGLKLNQIKRATNSYIRDRADHATGIASSYAIAAGLFAASGVFLIAASLVGATALFRWIEFNYGLFWAFGATGLLLVILAGICAGFAAVRLKRSGPHFPSLTSRLRVAVKANPIRLAQPASTTRLPIAASNARPGLPRLGPIDGNVQAGLAVGALLLGWAAMRRLQARRTEA